MGQVNSQLTQHALLVFYLFFIFCLFLYFFFFAAGLISKFFRMNLIVVISVLASALTTIAAAAAADSAATDAELRDALQEYFRAAEDLDEVHLKEENLAKLFRMEDSLSDARQAGLLGDLWDKGTKKIGEWIPSIKKGLRKGLKFAKKAGNTLLGEAKCDQESLAKGGKFNSIRCKSRKYTNKLEDMLGGDDEKKVNQLARLLMERSDQ